MRTEDKEREGIEGFKSRKESLGTMEREFRDKKRKLGDKRKKLGDNGKGV